MFYYRTRIFLEKQIAKVVRYAAKNLAMNLDYNSNIKVLDLNEILGSSKLLM